jgi:hypothetical protein
MPPHQLERRRASLTNILGVISGSTGVGQQSQNFGRRCRRPQNVAGHALPVTIFGAPVEMLLCAGIEYSIVLPGLKSHIRQIFFSPTVRN